MFKKAPPVKLFLKNTIYSIILAPKRAAPWKMGGYGCYPGKKVSSGNAGQRQAKRPHNHLKLNHS
jgi:hypothetical protein